MPKSALRALWMIALGFILAPGAQADSSLGSWTPVAPMSTPRFGAAAVALPDGDVLVAGGQNDQGDVLSTAEIYDPSTNTWTPTAPMSTKRMYAAAAPLTDGDVLVAGGQDRSGNVMSSAETFDPTTETWSAMPPMPEPRELASGMSIPGAGAVIAGGIGSPGDSISAAEFDDAGIWYDSTFGPANLVGAAMAPVASNTDEIFEAGGGDTTNGGIRNTAEESWVNSSGETDALPPMDAQRFLPTATALPADRILVAGGAGSTSGAATLSSAEIYDVDEEHWSAAAPMPEATYGAASAALANGQVLVVGGSDGDTATAGAELFTAPALPMPTVAGLAIYDLSGMIQAEHVHVGDRIQGGAGLYVPPHTTMQIQWQRCRATCADIAGAEWTGSWDAVTDYTPTASDVGYSLRAVVTATNSSGSATGATATIGPVLPAGFHLEAIPIPLGIMIGRSPSENQLAPIEVIRDDDTTSGSVHYRVWQPNAGPFGQFKPISGVLNFPVGTSFESIAVRAFDHGVPILAPELDVTLSDSSPLPVVQPSTFTQPIYNGPLSDYTRNPRNPLALTAAPPTSNPLVGAKLFVDRSGTAISKAAAALKATDPTETAMLDEIVDQPDVTRFGTWNGNYPGQAVQSFLTRVQQQEPGAIPMLATYKVVNSHLTHPECHHWADPPATQAEYHEWITNLAEGIGTRPAVLFLEMDSLITVGCLSPEGLKIRLHELRDAINVLQDDPHLVVYLDAGAADAAPSAKMARLLNEAGIAHIQGFFLNSTHFDWTSKEIKYGEEISNLTGGKHFVINTAENGQGPLIPKDRGKNGNEVLCNPPGRGLGPPPTTHTGYRNVDAFAWIANPGVSGGTCRPGVPPGGVFSVQLALGLVRHADFKVR